VAAMGSPFRRTRCASSTSPRAISVSAIFLTSLLLALAARANAGDESWFLQVAYRMATGAVLYRDVFFGATPLSAYLAAAGVWLFGAEVWVLRVVGAVVLALTILLLCHVGRRFGMRRRSRLLVASLALAYPTVPASLYTPLAYLFLLACFAVTVMWADVVNSERGQSSRPVPPTLLLAVAGATAGLCFGAKQNIGLFALGALGLTVITSGGGSAALFRRGVVALTGYCLAVAAVLVPVLASGGVTGLWDYGFANKSTYIQVRNIAYFVGLDRFERIAAGQEALDAFKAAYSTAPLLLPPLVTLAMVFARWRTQPGSDARRVALYSFVAAAVAGMWPHPHIHQWYAIPFLLLGGHHAWRALDLKGIASWAALLQVAGLLWAGVGVGTRIAGAPARWITGRYEVSTLPHFHGVLVDPRFASQARTNAIALRDLTAGESAFLLIPEAPFYYLVADLRNVTPVDYPYLTAFGRSGMADVAEAIAIGRIGVVCSGFQETGQSTESLRPLWLEAYVANTMEKSGSIKGLCTLFRSDRHTTEDTP
jgi:hypothetical protein